MGAGARQWRVSDGLPDRQVGAWFYGGVFAAMECRRPDAAFSRRWNRPSGLRVSGSTLRCRKRDLPIGRSAFPGEAYRLTLLNWGRCGRFLANISRTIFLISARESTAAVSGS